MLTTTIAVFVLGAAQETPEAVRKVQITNDNRAKHIQVNVGPNRITSVRLSRPFNPKTLFCGDTSRFVVQPLDESQITIKGVSADIGKDTNCNLLTQTAIPVALTLVMVEPKKADAFVDLVFALPDLPTSEVDLSRRMQQLETAADERVVAAVRECKDKNELALVQRAADAIVARHIDERAIHADVILTVKDFVKVGNRGIIRFELDNQSREAFSAGEVKLEFSASGKTPVTVETIVHYKQPVIDRNESTFGALSFDMYQLSEGAKFTLQVMEKSGARHPKVTGLRL
ncbi:MAG: DUF2381 family protein [Deltaproteobacteria bacterium]|nr:DUF2381 family protein [Deltaproteobacteria bacterium]